MKPVIIIAIAFVLFIPVSAFGDHPSQLTDLEAFLKIAAVINNPNQQFSDLNPILNNWITTIAFHLNNANTNDKAYKAVLNYTNFEEYVQFRLVHTGLNEQFNIVSSEYTPLRNGIAAGIGFTNEQCKSNPSTITGGAVIKWLLIEDYFGTGATSSVDLCPYVDEAINPPVVITETHGEKTGLWKVTVSQPGEGIFWILLSSDSVTSNNLNINRNLQHNIDFRHYHSAELPVLSWVFVDGWTTKSESYIISPYHAKGTGGLGVFCSLTMPPFPQGISSPSGGIYITVDDKIEFSNIRFIWDFPGASSALDPLWLSCTDFVAKNNISGSWLWQLRPEFTMSGNYPLDSFFQDGSFTMSGIPVNDLTINVIGQGNTSPNYIVFPRFGTAGLIDLDTTISLQCLDFHTGEPKINYESWAAENFQLPELPKRVLLDIMADSGFDYASVTHFIDDHDNNQYLVDVSPMSYCARHLFEESAQSFVTQGILKEFKMPGFTQTFSNGDSFKSYSYQLVIPQATDVQNNVCDITQGDSIQLNSNCVLSSDIFVPKDISVDGNSNVVVDSDTTITIGQFAKNSPSSNVPTNNLISAASQDSQSLVIAAGSTLINEGTIIIYGEHQGILDIQGTLINKGIIISSGSVTNSGSFLQRCGGVFTDNGSFSGNAIQNTCSNPNICDPPVFVDWTLTSSCTLDVNFTPSGDVIIQNNAVLTIPNGITLDIDFANNNLTVKSGGGVLIESGGKIT